ncbi:MAG TPA: hypothetical protein VFI15_08300 [Candidatus Limnocylindrales bacterium]|nr:hypothetical protein [Candidatus Limnocylindrales bacterium]
MASGVASEARPASPGAVPARLPRATAARLVRDLDDPAAALQAARALTADLGFLVVGDHLLVAMRDQPTLRHFDPESLSFYAPAGDGGALATVSRIAADTTQHRRVLWGHLHVVDRLPVENRFLTFGGTLEVVGVDASTTIAHLRSPAPIVRWGGHSQGTDALTLAIGAFFGRLIVPVDFVPGAAARIDSATPEVLYAAFLCDTMRRTHATHRLLGERSELDAWLATAWSHERANAATIAAAEALLADIGF